MDRTKSTGHHVDYKKKQPEAVNQGDTGWEREGKGEWEWEQQSWRTKIPLIYYQTCSDHPGLYTCKME